MHMILHTIVEHVFAVERALANGGPIPPITLPNPFGSRGLPTILNGVADGLLLIATPLVAIFIVVGGIQILFSAGNPEKFKKGKQTLLYTVIGFGIVLVAKGVSALIAELLR